MIVGPAYIILVGLLIILAIKVMYIEPALKLHTVSDPTFLKQFMKKQFNAFNDPALLNELSGMTEDMTMDYWYMYYHIRTEDLTFFTLLNRINRFSDACNLCVYGIDHKTDRTFRYVIPTQLQNISVTEINEKIVVEQKGLFKYTVDFETDILTYDITHYDMNASFTMKVEDWNTNQASFFPWYYPIRLIMDLNGHESHMPGEWMVDSPCIGKIMEGMFCGRNVQASGNFWFDTYTGTNYHWLAPYTWFYINTDEWVIYLLQYGEADSVNKPATPILIKNRKDNRWFHSGSITKLPFPFEQIRSEVSFKYSIDGNLGAPFEAQFRSDAINITLRSIPETIRSVFKYNYYKNDNNIPPNEVDKAYYEKIRNISFEEYLCEAEVMIEYDGKKTTTNARVLYEGMTEKR